MAKANKVTAAEALEKVTALVDELTAKPAEGEEKAPKRTIYMRDIASELGIVDFYPTTLSLNSLWQMKSFLQEAVRLGYTGNVKFFAGAKGTAHGMWAYTEGDEKMEKDFLFHSFLPSTSFWGYKVKDVEYVTDETLKTNDSIVSALISAYRALVG